jgi:2-polyprenyl-3-methyl-5-hydroxy-6-metoxy-1,4-benzoquinol methylase
MPNFSEILTCVACGERNLLVVLDLGFQPLANALKDDPLLDSEEYPLKLNRCKNCFHAQLSVAVNPALLFSNYLYASGTSTTLQEYFDHFTDKYLDTRGDNLKVLDIASNDGSFLKVVKKHGHRVLGVDPAANLLGQAHTNGIETVCGFWPGDFLDFVVNLDVIVAMNVFAHVQNPLDFLLACKEKVTDDGVIIIQTSQAKMIELGQFDTMYHEHISFFNTNSMIALAKRAGLIITNVTYEDIHGVSYVWEFRKSGEMISFLNNVVSHENKVKLFEQDTYLNFANKAESSAEKAIEYLSDCKLRGMKIIGYGVAAKGNTFIKYSNLPLDFMVDDNPLKQKKFTPGMNLEVFQPEAIREIAESICFLVPAWNFIEEIETNIELLRAEQSNYVDEIVTYFPEFRVKTLRGDTNEIN